MEPHIFLVNFIFLSNVGIRWPLGTRALSSFTAFQNLSNYFGMEAASLHYFALQLCASLRLASACQRDLASARDIVHSNTGKAFRDSQKLSCQVIFALNNEPVGRYFLTAKNLLTATQPNNQK